MTNWTDEALLHCGFLYIRGYKDKIVHEYYNFLPFLSVFIYFTAPSQCTHGTAGTDRRSQAQNLVRFVVGLHIFTVYLFLSFVSLSAVDCTEFQNFITLIVRFQSITSGVS